jgi:hypothetical protein
MGRTLPPGKTVRLSEAPVYLTGEKLALPWPCVDVWQRNGDKGMKDL